MEKAREKAEELLLNNSEVNEKEHQEHIDGIKPAINNLLHMYLPDDITLKECEILAMVINDVIWSPYKYVRPIGLKIGDKALRMNKSDGHGRWVKFTVNEGYLPLIAEFPEDYKKIKQ